MLDAADRQLWRDGERIDLNARYFDALFLLIQAPGQLIEKDQFFEEVWDDVVVSDSALAQCIKELRKLLGDDASNPSFIQTVPRHGYRFIGNVVVSGASNSTVRSGNSLWRNSLWTLFFGTAGGAASGLLGGMFYGFGLASADTGTGTLSTLLVLISLTAFSGLIGGFGVSLGLASAQLASPFLPKRNALLTVAGATLGGLFVGSFANLLGLDAFNLFFGHAPTGITGGAEGAALGAAISTGALVGKWIGTRRGSIPSVATEWKPTIGAGILGATAGGIVPLLGGNLMGGSLNLLATSFSDSRLQLEVFGIFFGELHFGKATQVALGSFEGLLFGACVFATITLGRRLST